MRDAERFANCWNVAGIVLDSGSARARGFLRLAAATLIDEDELPVFRQRSKRRPEHFVTEMQSAVDAEKRNCAIDPRTREIANPSPRAFTICCVRAGALFCFRRKARNLSRADPWCDSSVTA